MADTFYVKQNDKNVVVTFTCKDAAGVGVSLAGVSSVKFQAQSRYGGGTAHVNGAAVPDGDQVTNPGKGTYTLSQSDLDTADEYNVTIEVTFGDGHIETFPSSGYNTLIVEAELA